MSHKELVYVDVELVNTAATKLIDVGKRLSGIVSTCQGILDGNWKSEGGDEYGRALAENFDPDVKEIMGNAHDLIGACTEMGDNLRGIVTAFREMDALGGGSLKFEDK